MIIESIHIKEGFFERKVDFNTSVTLIHSQKNSCGKTTLLRCLLYGLGYNIPNTRKIKFNKCDVTITLWCEALGKVVLVRNNDFSIVMKNSGNEITFVLPEQQNNLHSQIFGTNNRDILENLLGAYYVDQEKGWTLLNRGVVIGSIHFNIESLIRGLANKDCSELLKKESRLLREREKYQQMSSVAQYRESLEQDTGTVAPETYEEQTNAALSELLIRERQLKSELRRIDQSLAGNKKFKNFVSEMKLIVQAPDGTVFPVTENNIVGLTDSIELLISKRKIISKELAEIISRRERLNTEKESECEQLSFINSLSQMDIFDSKILRIPLNPVAIQNELSRLNKEIRATRDAISELTRSDNGVIKSIGDHIISYGTELELGDKDSIQRSYIFTSNLKELSGAVLHKTAFAFRLAYILEIEKVLGIKLPIILDSPSGKEVDQENIRLMMEILKRDFSDHQIIIASIYKYDFENLHIEEIKERMLEYPV